VHFTLGSHDDHGDRSRGQLLHKDGSHMHDPYTVHCDSLGCTVCK
jgi:hypothetical protein